MRWDSTILYNFCTCCPEYQIWKFFQHCFFQQFFSPLLSILYLDSFRIIHSRYSTYRVFTLFLGFLKSKNNVDCFSRLWLGARGCGTNRGRPAPAHWQSLITWANFWHRSSGLPRRNTTLNWRSTKDGRNRLKYDKNKKKAGLHRRRLPKGWSWTLSQALSPSLFMSNSVLVGIMRRFVKIMMVKILFWKSRMCKEMFQKVLF